MVYVLIIKPKGVFSNKMPVVCKSGFSQKVKFAFCEEAPVEVTGERRIKSIIKKALRKALCFLPGFVMFDDIRIEDDDIFVLDYSNTEERNRIVEAVIDKKISNFYIYRDDKEFVRLDQSKPELGYLEFHVSWHCNLKCKGCGHYSNLQATPMFSDLSSYEKDLRQLHKFVRNISYIRLMGGEPLLNPDLIKFIEATRKEFPFALMAVASNGLLIPACDDSLLKAMSRLGVRFDITCYPPTAKILDKIKEKCNKFGVDLIVSDTVKVFFAASDGSETNDAMDNWQKCESKKFHFLYNGKLSACGLPIIANVMRNNTQYKGTLSDDDVLDIYDPNLTSDKLIEKMKKPLNMCQYCEMSLDNSFEWEGQYTEFFSSQILRKMRNQ